MPKASEAEALALGDSDQINTSTFSQNSPIRHLMRVALGALSGIVVELFVGLSAQIEFSTVGLVVLGRIRSGGRVFNVRWNYRQISPSETGLAFRISGGCQ